jgi:hypothetical protein
MVLPYVGILVGAVVLVRIPESDFERFWWFAPAAAFAYVAVLTLTVASLARRRRVARDERAAAAALQRELRNALDLSPADRRRALQRLVPDLHAVRAASGGLPGPDRTALRVALTDLDARAAVESELARSTVRIPISRTSRASRSRTTTRLRRAAAWWRRCESGASRGHWPRRCWKARASAARRC